MIYSPILYVSIDSEVFISEKNRRSKKRTLVKGHAYWFWDKNNWSLIFRIREKRQV